MVNLLNRRLFILHDQHPEVGGHQEVTIEQAKYWNQKGHGVFWVINDFSGDRLVKNLTHINAWFFECDDKPKSQQLALIEKGIYPSLVVESKNSFHVYFFAKDGDLSTFETIQGWIIQAYRSDAKIKDPLRLMRAPGYNHVKDPTSPFEVRTIAHNPHISYTTKIMQYYFGKELEKRKQSRPVIDLPKEETEFFDTIYNLDHLQVLKSFSGSAWVNGEQYDFRDNRNGKYNILVNGKSTHAFIDPEGRIGAVNGGPTIWQWLKYFGHSHKTIRRAIAEVIGC